MGLFDFLGGGDQPQAPNPQAVQTAQLYGVDPSVVQGLMQQRAQAQLGNVSAMLLAAAQGGPIGQRGQILSRVGDAMNSGPDVTQSLMNAAQMKLYAENLRQKQEEARRKEAARKAIEDLNLKGSDAAWAMANPDEFLRFKAQKEAEANDPYRKAQIQNLQALEADRAAMSADRIAKTAEAEKRRQAAEEWIKTQPPEVQALYRINPDEVLKSLFDQDIQRIRNQGKAQPGEVPGGPGTPGWTPPPSSLDPGVDFRDGIGSGAAIGKALNTALAPGGWQPAPGTDKALKAWERLNSDTSFALASAFGERGGSVYAIKRYQELTANPASIFETQASATNRVGEIIRSLDNAISELEQTITYGGSPAQENRARVGIQKIAQMKADYEHVLRQLQTKATTPAQGAAPQQGGAASPPPARIIGVRPVGQ